MPVLPVARAPEPSVQTACHRRATDASGQIVGGNLSRDSFAMPLISVGRDGRVKAAWHGPFHVRAHLRARNSFDALVDTAWTLGLHHCGAADQPAEMPSARAAARKPVSSTSACSASRAPTRSACVKSSRI
jgi:hypothetical protein